jgi:hypothetical protein
MPTSTARSVVAVDGRRWLHLDVFGTGGGSPNPEVEQQAHTPHQGQRHEGRPHVHGLDPESFGDAGRQTRDHLIVGVALDQTGGNVGIGGLGLELFVDHNPYGVSLRRCRQYRMPLTFTHLLGVGEGSYPMDAGGPRRRMVVT